MCINPNILVPRGFTERGKVHYDIFKNARDHFKGRICTCEPFTSGYDTYYTDKVLSAHPDAILGPCGQCVECRLHNANMYAIRCVHELQYSKHSCFVTLTYNDEHLPYLDGAIRPTLVRQHVQDFIKRLRRHLEYRGYDKIRFLYAGEYGSESFRPHYHLIIFNWFPDDVRFLPQCSSDEVKCFTSPSLERLWKFGFNCVGSVNFHSARYVAQYSLKKQTGIARSYYSDNKIVPEFVGPSTNPGLGYDFFRDNYFSIINNGFIVVDGVKYGIPRYYLDKLEELDPALHQWFIDKRVANAKQMIHDFDRDFARERILNDKTERFRKSYEQTLSVLDSFKKV